MSENKLLPDDLAVCNKEFIAARYPAMRLVMATKRDYINLRKEICT